MAAILFLLLVLVAATVVVLSPFYAATATSVRLRGGETQWDGRVEVLRLKEWGSICDVGWDLVDANVSYHSHVKNRYKKAIMLR